MDDPVNDVCWICLIVEWCVIDWLEVMISHDTSADHQVVPVDVFCVDCLMQLLA